MKDTSAVAATLADRFQIISELGAGGMATVYLARDLKHGREVALKVLLPELSADLGSERFLNEIRITAGLDHPHILTLIDSGASDGFLWYVLPYVRGESLRARLQRDKQLEIEAAVRITQHIASALDYAHGRGVIHRDIKPENILLFEGEAMLTDFGIALAVREAAGNRLTKTGLSLGTPLYMSPEQATGERQPDARSDVYSLGAVLYEMLAGEPPHSGATEHAIIARLLTERPTPLRTVRDTVPQALEQAVAKALARIPADRFSSAGLLARAATDAISSDRPSEISRRTRIPLVAFGTIVVIGAVAGGVALARRGDSLAPLTLGKATQITAEAGLEVHPAISPDGKFVAYSAGSSQHMRIFIRPIAGGRTIPLLDDPEAMQSQPRWSPDGSSILFLDGDGALVAPALGGSARRLVPGLPEQPVTTVDWSPDGRQFVFARGDSLFVRNVDEGPAKLIHVSVGEGDWLHSCDWSPTAPVIACVLGNHDFTRVGRRFGNLAPSQVLLLPAAGGTPVAVTDHTTLNQSPTWSPDGRLLYFISNHQGPRDIYAVPVSRDGRAGTKPIRLTTGLGAQSIGLTADGTRLIYSVYAARGNIWRLPIPLSGPVSIAGAVPITSGTQIVEAIRVSLDGNWLLYDSDLHGNSDIYRQKLAGGEPEQLTRDPAEEFAPDLSPDGRAVAFHAFLAGNREIVIRMLDGSPAEQVTPTPNQESFPRWSPGGTELVIWDQNPFSEVWLVRRQADGKWGSLIDMANELEFPSWSPDGRLILGTTLRTKGVAVVQAEGGEQRMLYAPRPGTTDPAVERVEWSPDGRTIYFKSLDAVGRASLWKLSPSGGRPQLLVRFDDPTRPSSRPDFATDGKFFYFTVEDRQSDIAVAEISKR